MELAKQTFDGTRCWLPPNHQYRSEDMKDHFNGRIEDRPQLVAMTVEKQISHAAEYLAWKEAGNREGAPKDPSKIHRVKCLSILHTFPY